MKKLIVLFALFVGLIVSSYANVQGDPGDYLDGACGQLDVGDDEYGGWSTLSGIEVVSMSYDHPDFPGIFCASYGTDYVNWDTIGDGSPYWETTLYITVYDSNNDEYVDIEICVLH